MRQKLTYTPIGGLAAALGSIACVFAVISTFKGPAGSEWPFMTLAAVAWALAANYQQVDE